MSADVKVKRNTKACKECGKQVPTACKTCPCGFCFRKILQVDSVDATEGDNSAVTKRRTQRTRRERPHFFDSLEYGSHVRKRRNMTSAGLLDRSTGAIRRKNAQLKTVSIAKSANSASRHSGSSHLIASSRSTTPSSLLKDSSISNGSSNNNNGCTEEDAYNELSVEKVFQYSIILAEINRKCMAVASQPR